MELCQLAAILLLLLNIQTGNGVRTIFINSPQTSTANIVFPLHQQTGIQRKQKLETLVLDSFVNRTQDNPKEEHIIEDFCWSNEEEGTALWPSLRLYRGM
jgi:hypothetical protein